MPWLSHPGCMCGVHHLSPPQYLIRASTKQLSQSIYLNSSGEIDYYLNTLFVILFNIVAKTVLFAKLNIHVVSWWTVDVNTAV